MKKTNAMRILEKEKIPFELLEYIYDPNQLDLRKIAKDNGLDARVIYKTLVVIGDKTGPVVAVLPGDKVLNLKIIAKISGNKRVYMAPIPDLEKLTGYIRGGCSPVGMKKSFPVYFDQSAEELGAIWTNAGIRGILFKVAIEDFLKVTNGQLADIAADYPKN